VLLHYRFDSVQGADGHLSQLLVAKLYREYGDSAFALWSQQQVGWLGVRLACVCSDASGAPKLDLHRHHDGSSHRPAPSPPPPTHPHTPPPPPPTHPTHPTQTQVPDVAALLGGAAAVEAAAAAAAAVAACPHAGEAVSTERAKEVLQQVLAARKQVRACVCARVCVCVCTPLSAKHGPAPAPCAHSVNERRR
jgi:hypothetical protein